jgi:hypothetical protein
VSGQQLKVECNAAPLDQDTTDPKAPADPPRKQSMGEKFVGFLDKTVKDFNREANKATASAKKNFHRVVTACPEVQCSTLVYIISYL